MTVIWKKHWRKSSEQLRRHWSWQTDKGFHYHHHFVHCAEVGYFSKNIETFTSQWKSKRSWSFYLSCADTCERLEPLSIEVYNTSWILCTEGCSLLPVGAGDLGSWSLIWVGAHKVWILESPHIYVKDWMLRSIGIDFFLCMMHINRFF